MRWWIIPVGLLGVGLGISCSAPNLTEIDLLLKARWGEFRSEQHHIPICEENDRAFLTGWSRLEADRSGRAFRWAVGRSSTVAFFCAEARDLQFELSIRPFSWQGGPAQGVRCRLNGFDLGWREIPGAVNVSFDFPASQVRSGANVVEFEWDRATVVRKVRAGSRDRRELAAAVSSMVVHGLEGGGRDLGFLSGGELLVPPSSEVAVALRAGSDALMEYRVAEGDGRHLQLWAREEGESLNRICGPCSDSGSLRLDNGEGPMQLVLRSIGAAPVHFEKASLGWPKSKRREEQVEVNTRHPDVFLYVVDTLRADQLLLDRGEKGLVPALEQLAADGVVFEQAVAQSSWTKASMVSLLSGLLTTEHGVRSREPSIPNEVELIAELFEAAGYRTGAFTTNAYLVPEAGFDRGFSTFEFAHLDAFEVGRRADEWLRNEDDGRPVFLWVHTVDPHAPYSPKKAFRERIAPDIDPVVGTVEHVRSLGGQPEEVTAPFVSQFMRLYRAEVAQNDAAFGLFLETLHQTGRYDDA